jgi:hypothetical protein
LWLRGLRGRKSTPIVGWEVPMKSSWLASRDMDGTQVQEIIIDFSPLVTVFSFEFALYLAVIAYMFLELVY